MNSGGNLETCEFWFEMRGLRVKFKLDKENGIKQADELTRFMRHVYQCGQRDLVENLSKTVKTDFEIDQEVEQRQQALGRLHD